MITFTLSPAALLIPFSLYAREITHIATLCIIYITVSIEHVNSIHSLAAEHDGTGNTCSAADRYLMAGTTSRVTPQNLRHPWFFSPCSATEISTFVNRILITP